MLIRLVHQLTEKIAMLPLLQTESGSAHALFIEFTKLLELSLLYVVDYSPPKTTTVTGIDCFPDVFSFWLHVTIDYFL